MARQTFNAKDFGAKGDGTTDDTAAIQRAITAAVSATEEPLGAGQTVFLPRGKYRVTASLTVPGSIGFSLVGDGENSSFLYWDGTAGLPLLKVNSCQHSRIANLCFYGNASKRPSELIYYTYSPVVFAATGNTMQNVALGGQAGADCYDIGIRLSADYGNNSEMTFQNVTVNYFKTAGFSFEGSQQKNLFFYGCTVNGANTGLVGVDMTRGASSQGGQVTWWGGAVSACDIGFKVGPPNDPIIIDGVSSEGVKCFLDMGTVGDASPHAVTIRNCRLDCYGITFSPTGYVKFDSAGPIVFEGNTIYSGAANPTTQPKIAISANGVQYVTIRNNIFLSTGSVHQDPILVSAVTQIRGVWNVGNNIYTDDSNQRVFRNEGWNVDTVTAAYLYRTFTDGKRTWNQYKIHNSAFTAAATSQSILLGTMPQGTRLVAMTAYQYEGFAASGAPAVTAKVGKTSGGNEYLLSFDATVGTTFFGKTAAELGSELTTNLCNGGAPVSFFAGTPVYVTVARGAGNLGNGTTTSFTTGYFFLEIETESLWRFVEGS